MYAASLRHIASSQSDGGQAQVGDKTFVLRRLLRGVRQTKQIRRMYRQQHLVLTARRQNCAALALNRYRAPQQRPPCGSAKRHDQPGTYSRDFARQPPAAMLDLPRVGALVDAPLAAWRELEVLHGIGDIALRP